MLGECSGTPGECMCARCQGNAWECKGLCKMPEEYRGEEILGELM